MTRLFLTLCLLVSVSVAFAEDDNDDWRTAGRKGTVTAYELDGRTVISHKSCLSSGRYSWKYVECGNRLRDSVKIRLCSRHGSGTHSYLYQIGDNRPTKSSVYCRR